MQALQEILAQLVAEHPACISHDGQSLAANSFCSLLARQDIARSHKVLRVLECDALKQLASMILQVAHPQTQAVILIAQLASCI